MQQSPLAKTLIDIAGSLESRGGGSEATLQAAYVALARAINFGQDVEDIVSPELVAVQEATKVASMLKPERISALESVALKAISEAEQEATRQPAARVYLRTTPILSATDPALSSWVRGMAPTKSLGPFTDAVGRPVWLDIFQPVRLVSVVRDPGAHPIGAFPIGHLQPAPNQHSINLSQGSVWLVSNLLAPASPANGFTGFRIRRGELTFSTNVTVANGVIHVQANTEVRLTATLDPPPAPSVSSSGPGVDAMNTFVDLPATLAISFKLQGAQVLTLGDSNATVFATSIALKQSHGAPHYEPSFQEIVIPCSPAPDRFTVADRRSKFFLLDGGAVITNSGWALPVTTTPLNQLSEAAGAGALVLEMEKGLSAEWPPSGLRSPFIMSRLHLSPGQIGIFASVKTAPFNRTFELWNEKTEPDQPPRRSSIDFFYSAGFDLLYLSQPGLEMVALLGGALTHLDRPVAADGGRFAFQVEQAGLLLVSDVSGQHVFLGGTSQVAVFEPMMAIGLENALLKVHAPQNLFMFGSLQTDGPVSSGSLFWGFSLRSILPMLPDPYAATFPSQSTGDADIGTLLARVDWPSPVAPRLAFSVSIQGGDPFAGFGIAGNRRVSIIGLLDVSSNADQLGVFFTAHRQVSLSIDQIALATAGSGVGIFTVPEISWEPMQSDQPAPGVDTPPNDGGPSTLTVATVHLSRIAPRPVLDLFIDRVADNNEPFVARITLPFGLRGEIRDGEYKAREGVFNLVRPSFGSALRGGLQLEMKPPRADIDPVAMFSGSMETVPAKNATPPTGYGAEVLQPIVANFVDDEFSAGGFKPGVPVHRYDLSGYGASVFSDWRNPDAKGAEVIQMRFDVFVGRTAYEVVQIQTFCYPFCARFVRTITIDRREAGWVHRHDSGWVAATPGAYQYPNPAEFPANRIHPGPVLGAFNIRRIREQQNDIVSIGPPGAQIFFEKVLYDADIKVDPAAKVIAGGFTAGGEQFVACRDLVGYVQIGRTPPSPSPATRAELAALLAKTGAVGGPISCVVSLGAAEAKLKAAIIDVAISDTGPEACVVGALRGVPVLPHQGSWSVAVRRAGQAAPKPLDPGTATPLIRGSDDPGQVWHYADPADIRLFANPALGAPQVEYGFLQSTGTQKLFFARPQIAPASTNIDIPDPPHLADAAALFSAASAAFPDLSSALQFDAAQSLPVTGEDINYDHSFTVTAPARPVVDFSAVKTVLDYHDKAGNPTIAHVHINPSAWQIELRRLSFQTIITAFGTKPLVTIVGVMKATSSSAPTFTEMEVIYGGFLDPVQTVFSNLQKLASFLPGGSGAGLKVSFSNGNLSVRDSYALPTLPLGFGEISDVSLNLGLTVGLTPLSLEFIAGIGSEFKPFHWLVSPLSGTGMIEVGARNGDMLLAIQAGIGAGLEINLGIAKGAASIVLAFQVDNKIAPFEIKVMLTGNAAVDVLAGLASASLTLTAMLGIAPDGNFPPKKITVLGGVAVGIHISICWVIDIDFDGHWQFSQEFTSPLNAIA